MLVTVQAGTVAHIKDKKLTKHVCQSGKSNLQTGISPSFWLLSTTLNTV